MLITEDKSDARYQIRAYEPGKVTVNQTHYTNSIIISPDNLITDWAPQSLTELAPEHLEPILKLKPSIVILGTGQQFLMPKAALLAPLYTQKLGVESMDTGAACRTYTALMAEGRNVVAALLIE